MELSLFTSQLEANDILDTGNSKFTSYILWKGRRDFFLQTIPRRVYAFDNAIYYASNGLSYKNSVYGPIKGHFSAFHNIVSS